MHHIALKNLRAPFALFAALATCVPDVALAQAPPVAAPPPIQMIGAANKQTMFMNARPDAIKIDSAGKTRVQGFRVADTPIAVLNQNVAVFSETYDVDCTANTARMTRLEAFDAAADKLLARENPPSAATLAKLSDFGSTIAEHACGRNTNGLRFATLEDMLGYARTVWAPVPAPTLVPVAVAVAVATQPPAVARSTSPASEAPSRGFISARPKAGTGSLLQLAVTAPGQRYFMDMTPDRKTTSAAGVTAFHVYLIAEKPVVVRTLALSRVWQRYVANCTTGEMQLASIVGYDASNKELIDSALLTDYARPAPESVSALLMKRACAPFSGLYGQLVAGEDAAYKLALESFAGTAPQSTAGTLAAPASVAPANRNAAVLKPLGRNGRIYFFVEPASRRAPVPGQSMAHIRVFTVIDPPFVQAGKAVARLWWDYEADCDKSTLAPGASIAYDAAGNEIVRDPAPQPHAAVGPKSANELILRNACGTASPLATLVGEELAYRRGVEALALPQAPR